MDRKKTGLVLELKLDEEVVIDGESLVVTLMSATTKRCRLLFTAKSRSTKIDRRKVYDAKVADGTY